MRPQGGHAELDLPQRVIDDARIVQLRCSGWTLEAIAVDAGMRSRDAVSKALAGSLTSWMGRRSLGVRPGSIARRGSTGTGTPRPRVVRLEA